MAVFLGQDLSWDLLDYHFYNGYAFAKSRYLHDMAPAMAQSYINPFFDLANYYILSSQNALLAIFILGTITGVTAFILFKITEIIFAEIQPNKQKYFYILCTLLIGSTGVATISTIGMTSNDNKIGLLVLLTVFFQIKSLISEEKKIFWQIASGLMIGLVTGFKLVAGCYAIGLALALFFYKPLEKENFKLCLIFGFSTILGFILANGYWMYFLNKNFNSPLFPYFNSFFKSPFIGYTDFKDSGWNMSDSLFFLPFTYLKLPIGYAHQYMVDARFAIISTLLIFLAITSLLRYSKHRADSIERFLILFFIFSYITWALTFRINRFLVPLEFLSGLMIIFLIRKLFSEKIIQNIFIAIITIYLLNNSIFSAVEKYPIQLTKENLQKKYFTISELPELPDNSIIFLHAPVAYLIPYFPESIKFIGAPFVLSSGGFSKEDYFRPILYQQASQILLNPNSPNYILFCKSKYEKFMSDAFAEFKISKKNKCQEFQAMKNIHCSDGVMQICPVKAKIK